MKRPNMCYLSKKQKVKGFQIWHSHARLVVSGVCLVVSGACSGASGCVCIMGGHVWWCMMVSDGVRIMSGGV